MIRLCNGLWLNLFRFLNTYPVARRLLLKLQNQIGWTCAPGTQNASVAVKARTWRGEAREARERQMPYFVISRQISWSRLSWLCWKDGLTNGLLGISLIWAGVAHCCRINAGRRTSKIPPCKSSKVVKFYLFFSYYTLSQINIHKNVQKEPWQCKVIFSQCPVCETILQSQKDPHATLVAHVSDFPPTCRSSKGGKETNSGMQNWYGILF